MAERAYIYREVSAGVFVLAYLGRDVARWRLGRRPYLPGAAWIIEGRGENDQPVAVGTADSIEQAFQRAATWHHRAFLSPKWADAPPR